MDKFKKSPYLEHIQGEIPGIISLVDREITSQTYGCGDRTFWCWKFTDFPGARFQEYIYTICWLYSNESFENNFKDNTLLLEWIEGGIDYWTKIQHKNGSFDEAYPNEHSLAATAFTLFYITEAYLLVEKQLSKQIKNKFKKTALNAADWLCLNDETHGFLSNHLAAAATALYNVYDILGDNKYINRSNYFKNRILSHQSDEGWYEEYGGADPGYQTHGSFYLARLFKKTQDSELLESLKNANKFLSYFIHPDGSIGGEYSSRNTMFYYPATFEILYNECEFARVIANKQRKTIAEKKGVGVWQMDAYNIFPVLNNYIFAFNAANHNLEPSNNTSVLPCETEFEKLLKDCGIYLKSTKKYYAILGGKKGGVIRIFDKTTNKLAFQSCGYIDSRNNEWISNQFQGVSTIQIKNGKIIMDAPFVKMNQRTFTPIMFVLFRIYNIFFGRIKVFAYWLKLLLVKKLINLQKQYGTRLIRQIRCNDDSFVFEDSIVGKYSEKLRHVDKFTTFHMGSSRYADTDEEAIRGRYYHNITLKMNGNIIERGVINFDES